MFPYFFDHNVIHFNVEKEKVLVMKNKNLIFLFYILSLIPFQFAKGESHQVNEGQTYIVSQRWINDGQTIEFEVSPKIFDIKTHKKKKFEVSEESLKKAYNKLEKSTSPIHYLEKEKMDRMEAMERYLANPDPQLDKITLFIKASVLFDLLGVIDISSLTLLSIIGIYFYIENEKFKPFKPPKTSKSFIASNTIKGKTLESKKAYEERYYTVRETMGNMQNKRPIDFEFKDKETAVAFLRNIEFIIRKPLFSATGAKEKVEPILYSNDWNFRENNKNQCRMIFKDLN